MVVTVNVNVPVQETTTVTGEATFNGSDMNGQQIVSRYQFESSEAASETEGDRAAIPTTSTSVALAFLMAGLLAPGSIEK